jgi:hypothetical protein
MVVTKQSRYQLSMPKMYGGHEGQHQI